MRLTPELTHPPLCSAAVEGVGELFEWFPHPHASPHLSCPQRCHPAHPHPHNTVQDAQCKQSLRALPGQHLCLTSCPPTGKGHTGESRSSGYRAGEPSSVVEHLPDRCESLGSAFSTGYQGTRDRTAMRPLSKMEKPGPGNFKDSKAKTEERAYPKATT